MWGMTEAGVASKAKEIRSQEKKKDEHESCQ